MKYVQRTAAAYFICNGLGMAGYRLKRSAGVSHGRASTRSWLQRRGVPLSPLVAVSLATLLLSAVPSFAVAQSRVALVIGNSDYSSDRLANLPNAAKDAAGLAQRLRELGFTVVEAQNAGAVAMRELIAQAGHEDRSEALLFYFAGHAVTSGSETFLLPADSPDPESFERLTADAVKLSDAVRSFVDPKRPTLVFVDACRTQGAGESPALPRVAGNVFLGFSSQAGEESFDGAGTNGPFARAMLAALDAPGLEIKAVFARISEEAKRLTLGRQIPWRTSTLQKPFFFRAEAAAVPPGG